MMASSLNYSIHYHRAFSAMGHRSHRRWWLSILSVASSIYKRKAQMDNLALVAHFEGNTHTVYCEEEGRGELVS